MKNLLILKTALLLLLILFVNCDSNSNDENVNPIQGQWKLVNVTGTFGGINSNFPNGMITWNFNSNNQTVTVVNNNPDQNLWDVLESGTYDYEFINNPDSPCGEQIQIAGSVFGCYSTDNDSLVIDQSIADGFRITLVK